MSQVKSEEKLEEKKEKKTFLGNNKMFQKLKSVKHIEIIVAVVLGAIILLIYFSTFTGGNSGNATYQETNTSEYIAVLEDKLASVIGKIQGVGNVSVMLTLASGPEYVYATSQEEKTNTNTSNGSTTTSTTVTSEPIIISNEALIVKEIMPKIGGVVVVAGGAGNTKVKLEILKAIQALLDVPHANIEILVGK
jgi:stage III sporulation protein AG